MLGEFLVRAVQAVARGGEVQAGTGWQGGVKMVSKVTRISSDGKAGCPFCDRIAAGEYDDDLRRFDAVSFEPLNPVTGGHRLVVPKTHVTSALGHPAIAADTMAAAVMMAGRRGIGQCNFITSAGMAATQTVLHLHIHIIPRHKDDGLALPWTGQPGTCWTYREMKP